MSDDDPYRLVARGINASENSTGDVGATNSNSSATGNGQFLSGTWLPLLKSQRPDLSAGKSDQQLLSMRADPALAEDMTAAYAKQNALSLSDAGLPVTPATLHLAHVVGPGGAAAVLKAAPTAPLSAVLGQDAVAANPTWARMTVAQLHDRMHSRVQGGMAAASDEDAQWGKLGAQAQPAAPAAAPPLTDDEEAQWGKFGTQPVGRVPQPGEIDPLTGQKVQSMTNAPDSPLFRFMQKGAPVGGGGSPVATAIGSLPTDPDQRARILAAHYYPRLPLKDAMTHITPGPNGGMIVLNENGQPIYEDPTTPSIDALSSLRPGNLASYAASKAGSALPVVGGAAGVALAAPTSMVAGPALAAAGAATGDLARQGLARYFDPTPGATPINLVQTGKEALAAGVGQAVGAVGANALAPNALRIPTSDIKVVRGNDLLPEAADAYARAHAQGVSLTPGQATGLPSLLQYEDAAKTMPGTSDFADAFYKNQGNQLTAAGNTMLDKISPNANKTDAAQVFQQGAEDAIRLTRQNANAAARPDYEAAARGGNVMSPDLGQLTDVPVVKATMDKARQTYENLYRTKAPDTPDFPLWDLTKRQLDDAYNVASRAGERTDAMAIDRARQDLLTHLDAAYPSYAQARATAAPGQRLASRLEDSGVGKTADKSGDELAKSIVNPVFNQNPAAVAEARDAFKSAGREAEWYDGVRAHIQNAFDQASQSQAGLNPARLRSEIWGKVDNREAIKAALTPAQYEGFDNFMKTVEQASKTYPMNSLTATRSAAQSGLRSAAENQGNVKLIDMIGAAFSPKSYANVGNALLSGAREGAVQGNTRRIVGALFDGDGLKYLEAMAQYAPGSLKAGNATARLLARAAPPMIGAPATAASGQSPPPPANQLMPAQQ